MSLSPRPPRNASMLLLLSALDTTWRLFVPILGGVFAGIGLDDWLHTTPLATIICLILGIIVSIVLITRQLVSLRKPLK